MFDEKEMLCETSKDCLFSSNVFSGGNNTNGGRRVC